MKPGFAVFSNRWRMPLASLFALLALLPVVAQATDWPIYHADALKTGVDPSGASLQGLTAGWSNTLDGSVYASPVIASGIVVAATENNTVYGFHVTDGSQVWSRHLGTPVSAGSLPCGDIGPVTGITGTPVIDTATSTLYVVAFLAGSPDNHMLFALDLASGSVKWSHEVNPVTGDLNAHQQRGALALGSGLVYVAYGGLTGDCGNYRGQVIGFPESGSGSKISFVAPVAEVGMWNSEGPVVDSAGNVWEVTGNGRGGSSFGDQEAVIKLNGSTLALEDIFYPGNWAALDSADGDLGSNGIALLDGNLAIASGKSGIAFLLDQSHLGGQDGEVAHMSICSSGPFGGPAYDPPVVYEPCGSGVAAVKVDASTSPPTMTVLWTHGPGHASPIVAGGLVWALGGGNLLGMDPNTGATMVTEAVGGSQHFATPAAVDGRIFLPLSNSLMELSGSASGPPAAATNVMAVAGTGQATITWTPPSANPPVAWYAVYAYSPTGTSHIFVTAAGTSFVATGLTSGSYYVFTVTAYNGQWGPWSDWSPWAFVT